MHGLHYRQKSSRFFHQKKILVDFKNALIEKQKRNSKYHWSLFLNWNIKLFSTDLAHQIQQPIRKLPFLIHSDFFKPIRLIVTIKTTRQKYTWQVKLVLIVLIVLKFLEFGVPELVVGSGEQDSHVHFISKITDI